jgi:hypothetical protein
VVHIYNINIKTRRIKTMKTKLISMILITLTLSILLSTNVLGATTDRVVQVNKVYYNMTYQTYNINIKDDAKEVYTIELFSTDKPNNKLLKNLQKAFKGIYLIAIFDDKGTEDYIYDDEIVDWYILDN